MKFLRGLFNLNSINSCLSNNTWRIKDNYEKIYELEEHIAKMNISYDGVLLDFQERLNELEKDVKAIDDYTDILSRRIAKLKGKDNEKKDNLTGQENINL